MAGSAPFAKAAREARHKNKAKEDVLRTVWSYLREQLSLPMSLSNCQSKIRSFTRISHTWCSERFPQVISEWLKRSVLFLAHKCIYFLIFSRSMYCLLKSSGLATVLWEMFGWEKECHWPSTFHRQPNSKLHWSKQTKQLAGKLEPPWQKGTWGGIRLSSVLIGSAPMKSRAQI